MGADYEPPFVHGEQGERSAQVIQIDSSKHVATVAICSAICGFSMMAAIVCAIIAWNTETQVQLYKNRVMTLQTQHDELVARVERLHALQ